MEMHSNCLQGLWLYCVSAQRILPRLFLCPALSEDKICYLGVMNVFSTNVITARVCLGVPAIDLECFDTVGLAAGGASGL